MEALLDRYAPDEVMLTGMIHDHQARLRSFEMAAKAVADACREPSLFSQMQVT